MMMLRTWVAVPPPEPPGDHPGGRRGPWPLAWSARLMTAAAVEWVAGGDVCAELGGTGSGVCPTAGTSLITPASSRSRERTLVLRPDPPPPGTQQALVKPARGSAQASDCARARGANLP